MHIHVSDPYTNLGTATCKTIHTNIQLPLVPVLSFIQDDQLRYKQRHRSELFFHFRNQGKLYPPSQIRKWQYCKRNLRCHIMLGGFLCTKKLSSLGLSKSESNLHYTKDRRGRLFPNVGVTWNLHSHFTCFLGS
jgi:hypothetical protein